jgi:hypothetical protein
VVGAHQSGQVIDLVAVTALLNCTAIKAGPLP